MGTFDIDINLIYSGLTIMCAFIFGNVLGRQSIKVKKRDGRFVVNTQDPNKDVFTLDLEIPVSTIPEKRMLIFEVVNERSQEKPLA